MGAELLDLVNSASPEVVLLDVSVTGSIGLLREIAPHTRVVALGLADAGPEVLACAQAGVAGYVTRDESLDDLVDGLRTVARGGAACSPRTAAMLLQHVSSLASVDGVRQPAPRLTSREREILALLGIGLSNKQIGQRLRIELPTVKNHVHNVLEKLGVSGRHEAAQLSHELTSI